MMFWALVMLLLCLSKNNCVENITKLWGCCFAMLGIHNNQPPEIWRLKKNHFQTHGIHPMFVWTMIYHPPSAEMIKSRAICYSANWWQLSKYNFMPHSFFFLSWNDISSHMFLRVVTSLNNISTVLRIIFIPDGTSMFF